MRKTDWETPLKASIILEKTVNCLYSNYYEDLKVNWKKRFKKEDGKLLVNIKEYRSHSKSNILTKRRIGDFYYELYEFFGSTANISKAINQLYPCMSIKSLNVYFSKFVFSDRHKAIQVYLALKNIKMKIYDKNIIG